MVSNARYHEWAVSGISNIQITSCCSSPHSINFDPLSLNGSRPISYTDRLSVLCLALSLPSHSNLFIGKSFMATYLYCFAFNYHTVSITFNFCPCATFSVSGKNNSFLTPPPSTMTVSNRSFKDVLLVQPAITCPASSTYAPHDQGQRATPPISQVPTFSECNLHISSSYNDDFPPIQKRTATTT